jgi:xanthine dehydrogenase accessory factor
MKDLLPDIERWREAGKRVAVATVVNAYGSAPRRAGAKMAINQDGEFVGSVSGGCVENDVVEHARQAIDENYPRLVPYGISDDMAFNVGLACGGQIEVFIEPFDGVVPTDDPVAVASIIEGDNLGRELLVWETGERTGTLGRGDAFAARVAADALALLRAGQVAKREYDDAPGGPVTVFIDTYPARPTIVIFGAVHVGVALARLAKAVGEYRVVVVDARGVWATRERFPQADEIHVMRADDYLAAHPLGSNAYVAVLSHDPKLDDPALIGALPSPARYVGALGSNKTQRERRTRLLAAGLSDEQLDRLFGPIGLDISAQTPEEIALSILGQMISVKNRKLTPAAPELASVAR